MARPALEFCQPIADEILRRISCGETLTAICEDDSLPALTTVYKWLNLTPAFAKDYTHAREVQAEGLADKAQAIAERTHVVLPNGMYVPADPTRDKLAVDTIKWRAAHLKPKVWGDKQFIEHSGQIAFGEMTDEDLFAAAVELIAQGKYELPNGVKLVADDEAPAPVDDDFDPLEFA